MVGQELASQVSTTYRYEWGEGTWRMDNGYGRPGSFQPEEYPYTVVAWDFGIKENILRLLADRGVHVVVVPAKTNHLKKRWKSILTVFSFPTVRETPNRAISRLKWLRKRLPRAFRSLASASATKSWVLPAAAEHSR